MCDELLGSGRHHVRLCRRRAVWSDRTAYEAHLVSCDTCAHATALAVAFQGGPARASAAARSSGGVALAITLHSRPSPRRDVSGPWPGLPAHLHLGHRSVRRGRLGWWPSPAQPSFPRASAGLSTFHHDVPLDDRHRVAPRSPSWFPGKLDFHHAAGGRRRSGALSGRPAGECARALWCLCCLSGSGRPPSGADGVSSRR